MYNKNEKIEKFEANLLQLIKDTVTKSKSLPYDKGFILIAFSPGNQLLPAIDFLKETVRKIKKLFTIFLIKVKKISFSPNFF